MQRIITTQNGEIAMLTAAVHQVFNRNPGRGVAALVWACMGLPLAVHAADGLQPPDSALLWPQWQARLTVSSTALTPVFLLERTERDAALVGNYYFQNAGLRLPAAWDAVGGLRATSGVLTAQRYQSGTTTGLATWPYMGLGYSGQALKGGWGFSADLGLALNAGGTRLGRAVFGAESLDTAVRELRLSPVMQVGVRYAF